MTEVRSLRLNRDFRFLWTGQTVSVLGGNISSVAYPLMALALTHSAIDAGLVALANTAPFPLLQLPAGIYVDRWNRRAVLLVSDSGRALVLGSVALLIFMGHLALVELIIAALVEGSLFVPFRLAEMASLRRIVSTDQLPDAIALNQGQTYGTSVAGTPLGGLLYALRPAIPFLADAVSYVASLLTVAAIRTPLRAPFHEGERQLLPELVEGLKWTWNHPFVRSTALLSTGSDFVINGLFLLLVVLVRERGASSTLIGGMLGLGATGGVVGSLAAPFLRRFVHSLRAMVVGILWIDAALVGMLVLTSNPIFLGILLGLILSLWPLYNAVVQGRWLADVPDALLGRVNSAVALLGWAPVPLAPLAAGVLLQLTGRVVTILCFAGLMLCVAVAATLNRNVRKASASSPPVPAPAL